MAFDISFRNKFQEDLFWCTTRNQCGSGGFNNGKTYELCQKALFLALSFSNYRSVMARQTFKNLKATTMQTFFKIVREIGYDEIIASHNDQVGVTILKNGSLFYWMHLDAFDEASLRGLEINSVFVDQAEEMQEGIYLVLDSRIGRWDKAEVPPHFLTAYSQQYGKEWPVNEYGIRRIPNYMCLGCNPDSQFHFIYQRYHPDSLQKLDNHIMFQAATDESLGDPETMSQMKGRDPEWVRKYFKGEWGISEAQVHYLNSESILDPIDPRVKDFVDLIRRKGNLYRILDHGETSPTVCTWFAAYKNWHVGFREYYMPNAVISKHRQNIYDLSNTKDIHERYSGNYADPDIFKKHAQKDGGFWSVAEEYTTKSISGPPLSWAPADNNEFATRNRLNELLALDPHIQHPISGDYGSPRLYFVKRTREYPQGIYNGITELQSQRRTLLTTINGKPIYSDDREKSIVDHAYDTIRYYIAMHGTSRAAEPRFIPRNSFAWYNRLTKRQRKEVIAASSVN